MESQEQLCYFSCILNEFQEWLLSVISLQGKLSKAQCPVSGPVSVTTSTGFRSTEQKETTLNHKIPAVTSWSAVSSGAQQPGQCLSHTQSVSPGWKAKIKSLSLAFPSEPNPYLLVSVSKVCKPTGELRFPQCCIFRAINSCFLRTTMTAWAGGGGLEVKGLCFIS